MVCFDEVNNYFCVKLREKIKFCVSGTKDDRIVITHQLFEISSFCHDHHVQQFMNKLLHSKPADKLYLCGYNGGLYTKQGLKLYTI